MGLGNLPNVTGIVIEQDHVNDVRNALRQELVGRNSGGAPTAGQELGTAAIPWGTLYSNVINVGGKVIDFDNLGVASSNNAVISAKTRTESQQPDFMRAAGTGNGAEFTILATDTDLVYTANAESATVTDDVVITGVTLAPSADNTCLINDTSYTDQDSTKYEGEGTGRVTIDTAGTEITNRIGQYVAFKAGTEIMMAFVESATVIRNVFRGFFFDSSGAPIVRETLANNDTLTLLSLGWVYGENNGTVFDVSYRSPYIQFDEPSAGVTDDYWFDIENQFWRRYNGSNWIEINRTLLGWVVADTADCIASRSIDFSKAFNDLIELEVEVDSITTVRATKPYTSLSVYGGELFFHGAPYIWDITAHLETGLTEANSTLYYLYITEDGAPIISIERPYDRRGDLKGHYHPYHSWRFVGVCYNSSGGDITSANSKNNNQARVEVFTASGEYLPLPNVDSVKVTVVAGGGGGGGISGSLNTNGSNGGSSSFGNLATATGGAGAIGRTGGNGGGGSGGDINIGGGDGLIGSPDLGGCGGDSLFGGIAKAGLNSNAGAAGNSYGGGGGGSGNAGGGAINGSGGGGGGGSAIVFVQNISSRISVTVGAGGAGYSGGTLNGGTGAPGIVIVED